MIVPLDAEKAAAVVDNADEWGRRELVAAFGPDYRAAALESLANVAHGWAYLRQERPTALLAGRFMGDIYTPWMLFTPEFPRISPQLTGFVLRVIVPLIADSAVSRAESLSLADNVKSHGWLGRFGAKPVEFLPGYGRQGEDVVRWCWTRDNVSVQSRRRRTRQLRL